MMQNTHSLLHVQFAHGPAPPGRTQPHQSKTGTTSGKTSRQIQL